MNTVDIEVFTGQWSKGLIGGFERYALFAGGIWLILVLFFASRKIRKESATKKQMLLEIAMSCRSIVVFSAASAGIFFIDHAGYLNGPKIAAEFGPWKTAFTLVAMVVVYDGYFYWIHRFIHHPRLFKFCHNIHHRSHNPTTFTSYSFNILEAMLHSAFVPLWMLTIPTRWEVVGFYALHEVLRNVIGHSGYEVFPSRSNGKPMFDFLTTVTHHDIHHSEVGWNYGLYFTWWDRLMGTEHPDYHARFAASSSRPTSQIDV